MTNDIPARVARGASLLDEKRLGWWEFTDLDTLDLENPCRCVLGQEYGDYHDAWDKLADLSDGDWAVEYGFDAELPEVGKQDYASLTTEWRRVIEGRRSAS